MLQVLRSVDGENSTRMMCLFVLGPKWRSSQKTEIEKPEEVVTVTDSQGDRDGGGDCQSVLDVLRHQTSQFDQSALTSLQRHVSSLV